MILDRFLVKEKLTLLVVVPLVAVVLTTVPFLAERVSDARNATATQLAARTARSASTLIQDLEHERLISIAYLAEPLAQGSPLVAAQQDVADSVVDIRGTLGSELAPGLSAAMTKLDALSTTRAAVLGRTVPAAEVLTTFGTAIAGVIDSLALTRQAAQGSAGARPLGALEALLQAEEQSSAGDASTIGQLSGAASVADSDVHAQEQLQTSRFEQLAEPAQVELVRKVGAGVTDKGLDDLLADAGPGPGAADRDARIAAATSAAESVSALRGLVQDRVARDVADTAAGQALSARIAAGLITLFGIGVFALVVILSIAVGRSISRPLQRLTRAATAVADLAQLELIRVADEENAEEMVPQLAAIEVRSSDEIGALAVSFNRVQATAALLLERQVISRRNVAAMFSNLGRRTHNLVGRQLSIIDRLEREEQDPEVLGELYRLDHISARLRRGASSLIVLSGVIGQELTGPRPLADVVRAALGEVEGFQQVRLGAIGNAMIASPVAADLALVIAELVENAAAVSPPERLVELEATLTIDGGCQVRVVDHGIGLSPERLAVENRRLVERERLDLAPTSMLGLFVVGRLGRRHGLTVTLVPSTGGGITAVVDVPPNLVTGAFASALERRPGDATDPAQAPDPMLGPALSALSAAEIPSNDFPWFAIVAAAETVAAVEAGPESAIEQTVEQPIVAVAGAPDTGSGRDTAGVEVDIPHARGGLTRRVRFAQLPDEREPQRAAEPRTASGASEQRRPGYQDPEAARAAVEAFQTGAALGRRQNVGATPGHSPNGTATNGTGTNGTSSNGTSSNGTGTNVGGRKGTSRNGAGTNGTGPSTGRHSGTPNAESTGQGERAGLTRRVRGASLSELIPSSRSNGAWRPSPTARRRSGSTADTRDPAAAKAMAEAFEGGADRAAKETAPAHDQPRRPEEG